MPGTGSAAREWKTHWKLVLASTAGFSLHPVPTYAIGLFVEPLGSAFGWSRAKLMLGLTVTALATVVLSPLIGALIDRWGSRRLAIPGTIAAGLSIAAFGTANGSMAQWLGLWSIFALVSLATKPTVWTAAVSGAFTSGRGIALAVTLSGVALAQILAPPIAYALIERWGWREAFVLLGLGWAAVAFVPTFLFFFDARDRARHAPAPSEDEQSALATLPGLSFSEALRSRPLRRITAATFLTMFLGIGIVVHQVPILAEAGVDRSQAAFLASLAGAAGIVGKLITGWLMDRRDSGIVGSATLAMAAVGYGLLIASGGPSLIVPAMLVIGYCTGAKLQIATYLTSRYGGIRNFGKIFGCVSSLIALGSGLGPVAAGYLHDIQGNYVAFLLAGIVGSLVSGALIFRLEPFPVWTQHAGQDSAGA